MSTEDPNCRTPLKLLVAGGGAGTDANRSTGGRELVATFEAIEEAGVVAQATACSSGDAESQRLAAIERAFAGVELPSPIPGPWFFDFLNIGVRRYFTVPDGFVMPVKAFSTYRTCKGLGLSAIWWWFGWYQSPYDKLVPTLEQKMPLEIPRAITSDPLNTRVDAFLIWKVVDAGRLFSGAVDFADSLRDLAIAHVRAECGKRRYNDLNKARDDLAEAVKASLKDHADRWGIAILAFEVKAIVHETNSDHDLIRGRP